MEYQDFRNKVATQYFGLVTKGAEVLDKLLDKGEEIYDKYQEEVAKASK